MIEKVISGGQTGADIAGLRAAKECKIATGGLMPRGFRTLDGSKPEYAELYGVEETIREDYGYRTDWNVKHSDATIRFAVDFESPGEKRTLKAIKRFNKPHLDVFVPIMMSALGDSPYSIHYWIKVGGYKVINIAGNSERTAPGIEAMVYHHLVEVFSYAE